MRYIVPLSIHKEFNKHLPAGTVFGYKIELDKYIVTQEFVESCFSSGISLDQISRSIYGSDLSESLNQYKQYKFKIYDLLPDSKKAELDHYEVPYDIDFKTQLKVTLHKKNLPKVQGKPTSVEYYLNKIAVKDENDNTMRDPFGNIIYRYDNLVCRIDFELAYNSLGFIIYRREYLKWYKEDHSVSTEYKDLGRNFDPILDHESIIAEGKERRASIINGLQMPVLQMLTQIFNGQPLNNILYLGKMYLERHKQEFLDFIDNSPVVMDINSQYYGKKSVYASIASDTDVWLDSQVSWYGQTITPRQYILSEVNI